MKCVFFVNMLSQYSYLVRLGCLVTWSRILGRGRLLLVCRTGGHERRDMGGRRIVVVRDVDGEKSPGKMGSPEWDGLTT